MAPIGLAIAALLVLTAGLAMALVLIALAWFNPTTVGEHLDVVKIALAVIGGIGGVVALVVAYRRQRLAEAGEDPEHVRQLQQHIVLLAAWLTSGSRSSPAA